VLSLTTSRRHPHDVLAGKSPVPLLQTKKLLDMVKIVAVAERENSAGEKFYALILQGGVEMVMSKETGRYYATAKTASVTSTFTKETCESLIGSEMPGSIQKQKCDPYEFVNPDTGEIVQREHRWVYAREGETVEEAVFEGEVATV